MAVELGSLGPEQEVTDDLRWIFGCVEGEYGLASNFGSMIAAIGGTSNQNRSTVGLGSGGETVHVRTGKRTYDSSEGYHDAMIGRISSVSRERRIMAGLSELSSSQIGTLRAMYTPRQYPNMVGEAFGQAAGPACCSRSAKKAYRADDNRRKTHGIREWLDEQCRTAAVRQSENPFYVSSLIRDIRLEVEPEIVDAHKAYAAARRIPPRRGAHVE
jgi:hypothetical protein